MTAAGSAGAAGCVVLGDADVAGLPAAEVLAAVSGALVAAFRGDLAGPPRVTAELAGQTLVFTAGGYRDGPYGFRVYAAGQRAGQQATLVWDGTGALAAVVTGEVLGQRRTGALGAAAVQALARADAHRLAVIGSGTQAWAQLHEISAARRLSRVLVYSPDVAHRAAFARRAAGELGLAAATAADPAAAVAGADIVVLATRSAAPVIDAAWIAPGTHLNTVGPKTRSAHEVPAELAGRAAVVVSDSPRQAAAYGEPFFTGRELVHLGAVLAGAAPGRGSAADVTLYCSVGLAGSEVALASRLIGRGAEPGDGGG